VPKAVLDLELCDPNQCASGACVARKQCPVKAIFQEEPFETPFLRAYPNNPAARKAIKAQAK